LYEPKRHIGRGEVQLHSFYTLAIDEGKLSVLHTGGSQWYKAKFRPLHGIPKKEYFRDLISFKAQMKKWSCTH